MDQYGGCFDNRARFLDEIYAAVRKEVGADFPVTVRISVNEYLLGGRTEAESFVLARHCEELGFDAIHVSNGMYASPATRQIIAPMFSEHAFNMQGVVPNNEAVVSLGLKKFATDTAYIMCIGMIANIFIARFSRLNFINYQ